MNGCIAVLTQTPHSNSSDCPFTFFENEVEIAMNRFWENTVIQSFVHFPICIACDANMHVLVLILKCVRKDLTGSQFLGLCSLFK